MIRQFLATSVGNVIGFHIMIQSDAIRKKPNSKENLENHLVRGNE